MNGQEPGAHGRAASKAAPFVHERLVPDLKAWIDNELPAPRVWLVRAHLLMCPACREEVEWLKRLGEDMRDLERAVPSPRLRARILAALPATPPGSADLRKVVGRRYRWAPAPAFAVFGALACAAAVFLWAVNTWVTAPATDELARRSASPRRPAGAEGSAAAAVSTSHPAISQPDDPHSLEADRLLARFLHDQDVRQARRLEANRSNWSRLVAGLQHDHQTGRATGPARLALAVPDVNDTEARLSAWARLIGGAVADGPHRQGSPAIVAPIIDPTERPHVPIPAPDAGVVPLLTLRIPAHKLPQLAAVLKDAGAWPAAGLGARVPAGKHGTVAGRPIGGAQAGVAPPTMASTTAGQPDQVAGRDSSPLLTLQLQLTSLDAPIH